MKIPETAPRRWLSSRHLRSVMSGLLVLSPAMALAQDDAVNADYPQSTFAGFGSLGAVHTSEKFADFSADAVNPGRAGFSRQIAYDVDSRLGAQLDVTFDRHWYAVVQLVAERNIEHDFSPAVEWANVSYKVNDDLTVRAGRIALPLFLAGDYRKTSYALPWVRAPVEVYGALPVTNSDGVDVSYRWNVGNVNNVTQASFGRTKFRVSDIAHAQARQIIGLSNTTAVGDLTVRVSSLTAVESFDLARPLFDAFRTFGTVGAQLADKYDVQSKRSSVASIGFNYDPGRWFLMGEFGRGNSHSYLGDKSVAYLSAGVRIGEITPYLTYSTSHSDQAISDAGIPLTGLTATQAGTAGALNAQLNALLRSISIQHTVTAGARWDFMADRSLKLQYDRVRPQGGSNGSFLNVQPGFRSGQSVNAVSVLVDFLY